MFTGLIIVAIIAGILLVLIILAQNPKGGINNQLGAGSNVLGVKKTTDFLEKATWGLAIVVITTSIAASKFAAGPGTGSVDSTVNDALNGGQPQTEQLDQGTDGDNFNFDEVEDPKDSTTN